MLFSQSVYCSDIWDDLAIGLCVRVQVKLIQGGFVAVSWGFSVSSSQRTVTITLVSNSSIVPRKNAQTPAVHTFFKRTMKLIGKGASKPWQSRLLFLKWRAAWVCPPIAAAGKDSTIWEWDASNQSNSIYDLADNTSCHTLWMRFRLRLPWRRWCRSGYITHYYVLYMY